MGVKKIGSVCIALVLSLLGASSASAPLAESQATYAFDDEFDGSALDTGLWIPLSRGGDTSNAELQCYLPSNVSVAGGMLTLASQRDPGGCASIGTNYQYSSGAVIWNGFNFLYGTVTARIKFAGGAGTWPALWLLGADCQAPFPTTADNVGTCNWPAPGSDEIDIAEILHSNHGAVNEAIHSSSGDPGCGAQTSDVSQNFHEYVLDWQPGRLTFQIDGQTTCTLRQAVPSRPMFLIINNALGGQGGNVDQRSLPQTTLVDYVRVSTANPSGPAISARQAPPAPAPAAPPAAAPAGPDAAAAPAPDAPAQPAPDVAAQPAVAGPALTGGLLVGDANVEAASDTDAPGTAEAFQYVAGASGAVNRLHVYLGGGSGAPQVHVGLYSDRGGQPGDLLTSGVIDGAAAGGWNAVDVAPVSIAAGQTYWIAVLGPAGQIEVADAGDGGAPSFTSADTSLTSLPPTWASGATWSSSPLSAFASQEP